MSEQQAIDAILFVVTVSGQTTDERDIYRRVKGHVDAFDIDEDEFSVLWGCILAGGLVERSPERAGEPAWYVTRKGADRLEAGHDPSIDASIELARDPAIRIAAELRWIGQLLEDGFGSLRKDLREKLQDIHDALNGLQDIYDAINGLTDATRGQPTCADAHAEDVAAGEETIEFGPPLPPAEERKQLQEIAAQLRAENAAKAKESQS